MRVRWYHAPLLYGLGVFLGALLYGLRALILFRVPAVLDPFLYFIVFLGAYMLPYTMLVWLVLMPLAGALGGRSPRLAVLVCIGTGLAVSLFGLLVVLPDVYRAIG